MLENLVSKKLKLFRISKKKSRILKIWFIYYPDEGSGSTHVVSIGMYNLYAIYIGIRQLWLERYNDSV